MSATRRLHSLFYGRRRLLQPRIDIAIGRRLIEMSGVDLGHLVEGARLIRTNSARTESLKNKRRTRRSAAASSTDADGVGVELVGVRGFEPPAPSSRS